MPESPFLQPGMARVLADLTAALASSGDLLRELRGSRQANRWSAHLLTEVSELAGDVFDFERSRWSVEHTMAALARCRARLLHIAVVALGATEWLDSGCYLPRT